MNDFYEEQGLEIVHENGQTQFYPEVQSSTAQDLVDEIKRLSNMLEVALAEGDNPTSMNCQAVLDEVPKCYDFSGSRRFAACRAWQVMEQKENTDWREAIKQAWGEIKSNCNWE